MTRIVTTPRPPRQRPRDWAQPQTVISNNTNPVQHFPQGPYGR